MAIKKDIEKNDLLFTHVKPLNKNSYYGNDRFYSRGELLVTEFYLETRRARVHGAYVPIMYLPILKQLNIRTGDTSVRNGQTYIKAIGVSCYTYRCYSLEGYKKLKESGYYSHRVNINPLVSHYTKSVTNKELVESI